MGKASPTIPHTLHTRWQKLFDNSTEFEAFLHALNAKPYVAIRLHPWKASAAHLTPEQIAKKGFTQPVPWHPRAHLLTPTASPPEFWQDPLWFAGAYHVQEPAGLILTWVIHHLLNQHTTIHKPLLLCDLCASPGGKTLQLADFLLGREGAILSIEWSGKRIRALQENLLRWSTPDVIALHLPGEKVTCLPPVFDLVIVDAPCSGEGYLRKSREPLRSWSPKRITYFQRIQQRLIHAAIQILRPGGYLIYSTCTWTPEENELNLQWAHNTFPDLEPITLPLPQNWHWTHGPTTWNNQPLTIHTYRCYPHQCKGEGFVFGVLRKRPSPAKARQTTSPNVRTHESPPPSFPKSLLPYLEQHLCLWGKATPGTWLLHAHTHWFVSQPAAHLYEWIHACGWDAQIVWAGIPVWEYDKRLHPGFALACLWHGALTLTSTRDALTFLRNAWQGKPTQPWITIGTSQWQPVVYQNLGLGWVRTNPSGQTKTYVSPLIRLRRTTKL